MRKAKQYATTLAVVGFFAAALMAGGLAIAKKAIDQTGDVLGFTLKQRTIGVIHIDVDRSAKGDYGVFKSVAQSAGHCFKPFCIAS